MKSHVRRLFVRPGTRTIHKFVNGERETDRKKRVGTGWKAVNGISWEERAIEDLSHGVVRYRAKMSAYARRHDYDLCRIESSLIYENVMFLTLGYRLAAWRAARATISETHSDDLGSRFSCRSKRCYRKRKVFSINVHWSLINNSFVACTLEIKWISNRIADVWHFIVDRNLEKFN